MLSSLLFIVALAVSQTSAVSLTARQSPDHTGDVYRCQAGARAAATLDTYHPGAEVLAEACLKGLSTDGSNIWQRRSCVAAAIGQGPTTTVNEAYCHTNIAVATALPSLDYGVYASIVGSCAYAQGGCPVTVQNIVDLYYGELSAANSTAYPEYDEFVKDIVAPMFKWAGFSQSAGIPYLNFNDFLHYADSSDIGPVINYY